MGRTLSGAISPLHPNSGRISLEYANAPKNEDIRCHRPGIRIIVSEHVYSRHLSREVC